MTGHAARLRSSQALRTIVPSAGRRPLQQDGWWLRSGIALGQDGAVPQAIVARGHGLYLLVPAA